MGARIPPNDRPRRGGINCEFCGRAVQSAAALESHQAVLHSQALKEKARAKAAASKPAKVQNPATPKVNNLNSKDKVGKEVEEGTTKTLQKKSSSVPSATKTTAKTKVEAATPKVETAKTKVEAATPKVDATTPKVDAAKSKPDAHKLKADVAKSNTNNTKLKVANTKSKVENLVASPVGKPSTAPAMEVKRKVSNQRNLEYKCPICEKLFPVLFFAQKHIQKYHCVNSRGQKVAQNAPDIIQPILLELCIYCDQKFAKPHDCPNRPNADLMSHACLGCQQEFSNNKLFHSHVADVHGDSGESLFFPTKEEFVTWKEEMEDQTACKYVPMGKYNSKQVYQCSEYTDNETENTRILCPSSFIVTKYPKGLQVHYFPTHYEHDCEEYELQDRYKTFSVSEMIHKAGNSNDGPDEDLYIQFKTLMDNIVLDAAKLNIDALKTLMNRAKDMETILQDYDEDKEVEIAKGRFTISLSTRAVSNSEGNSSDCSPARNRKRTVEQNGTEAKKARKTTEDTKTLLKSTSKKSFSLADDKDSDNILKELDGGNVQRDKTMQSPSFTDAYKDFIMNASKKPVGLSKTAAPKAERHTAKKKNIVKTKMGQFKGPSPKKIAKRNSIGATKDIEYEVRERDEDCNILVLKI
ncbi:hypothetical protein O0L34_g10470 [Tuta absoluta]|nr:hypothetical protein O0L34_g10470 [Tuta absoluta]